MSGAAPDTEPMVEPAPVGPLLAVVAGFATVTVGAVAAAVIVFGVVLVAGLIGEEVLQLPSVFDVAFRASMATMMAVIGAALLAELLRGIADRWIRLRLATRRFADPGAPRLPTIEHRRLVSAPYTGLIVIAWFAVVLGPLLVIFELVEGFDYGGIPLLIGVAMTAGAVGLFRSSARLSADWDARVATFPGPIAARLPEVRRVAAWRMAGGFALQIGVYLFIGGVMLRQPCRDCDQIDYGGGPVESVIDVLVGAGGLLILVPMALLLASMLPFLIRRARRERRTVRAARNGELRVHDEDVGAQLVELGTLECVAYGLTVLGFVLVMVGGTSWGALANSSAAPEDIAALAPLQALLAPGAVLVVLGLAAGIAGVVEARARRLLIYRAMPGYDYAPPVSDGDG